MGEFQAEPLDVFQRLAGTVRSINKTKVMQVNIAAHVRVPDIRRKNAQQGIFFLDALGQRQVGRLTWLGDRHEFYGSSGHSGDDQVARVEQRK